MKVDRQTVELFVHESAAYEIAKAEDIFVNPDGSSTTVRDNLFIRWVRGSDGKRRFDRVLLSPLGRAAGFRIRCAGRAAT